jgi:hypothetical protein
MAKKIKKAAEPVAVITDEPMEDTIPEDIDVVDVLIGEPEPLPEPEPEAIPEPTPVGTLVTSLKIGSKFRYQNKVYQLVNNKPLMAVDITGDNDIAVPFASAYVDPIPFAGPQAQMEE